MSGRVGAVSYLNSKPLIYGLRERLAPLGLMLDLPSRLADRLSRGELDVALIPSVEFLRSDQRSIVSDACIACRGPVRSVQLLFRVPPHRVRSLALDEGSRTSAALAQVLLYEEFGLRPELQPLAIDAPLSSSTADALVVIGDRAMNINPTPFVETWDLGERWHHMTGLPFVFAMWIAKSTEDTLWLSDILRSARDEGLAHLTEIIRRESPKYGLTEADCRRYFEEQLHFFLGSAELAGLELFRSQAAELGLVPEASNQLILMPI